MSGIEMFLFIVAIVSLLLLFCLILVILGCVALGGSFVMALITRFSLDCSITERGREVEQEQKDVKIIKESLQKQIDSLV